MISSRIFKFFMMGVGILILLSMSVHAQNIAADRIDAGNNKMRAENALDAPAKPHRSLITPEQFLDSVRRGAMPEVKEALALGMDVNIQNEFGESALHLVKDVRLAKYLIARGANVNLTDKEFGMTPLFFQEVPVARLLIAAGANVNARSHKGNTPVIWFAYSSYLEGIRYLVSSGADIHATNHDGQTVLDVAEHFGRPELVHYLRSIGAEKKHEKINGANFRQDA